MDNSMQSSDPFETPALPQPKSSGVRRVNNMPLLIAGGVLVVFVILVAIVAYERAADVGKKGQETVVVDEGLADQVLSASGGRTGGLVGAQEVAPSLPVAAIDNLDLPPPPPPAEEDPLAVKLRAARLAMLQQAIAAKTPVNGKAAAEKNDGAGPGKVAPTAGANVKRDSVSEDIDSQLAALMQGTNGRLDGLQSLAQGAGLGGGQAGAAPHTPSYSSYDRGGQADRWRLDSGVEAPRTAFELRAGFVIPATLISGINSELPGQIIAQVSQDVYDTATGKYRLIPQGTRLVGTYDSKVAYGQRRVLIAWQRLVFPDGKAMDIGSMPGADSAGYAGFNDKVNNHYLRIFGSALLMSGVIAGVNNSQTNSGNDPFGSSTNTVLSQAIAQQLGRVATEMIQKNLNIAPTLEIRPGYRFNVMAVKDLTFDKPYQPFDY